MQIKLTATGRMTDILTFFTTKRKHFRDDINNEFVVLVRCTRKTLRTTKEVR